MFVSISVNDNTDISHYFHDLAGSCKEATEAAVAWITLVPL